VLCAQETKKRHAHCGGATEKLFRITTPIAETASACECYLIFVWTVVNSRTIFYSKAQCEKSPDFH